MNLNKKKFFSVVFWKVNKIYTIYTFIQYFFRIEFHIIKIMRKSGIFGLLIFHFF